MGLVVGLLHLNDDIIRGSNVTIEVPYLIQTFTTVIDRIESISLNIVSRFGWRFGS